MEGTNLENCLGSLPYARPRFHVSQPYEKTHGDLAIAMGKLAGITAQDWQAEMIYDWAAIGDDGQFVHRRCGGSIPRQVGKTVSAEIWVTYLLVAMGAVVLWTDHNYSTTTEMLRRFREIFGTRPNDPFAKNKQFNKLVDHCNNKTAQEAIFLTNGGSLHFSTRTKSSSLGYSFDVVVYDEAQELTDEQQQAILPTTTSGPMGNMQSIYVGTPVRAGNTATIFKNIRNDAIEGGADADDLCWWEWGVDDVGDIKDETRWALVNPSIGRVANIEAIRSAARSMSELAFAQEYLGYWLPNSGGVQPLFDAKSWGALRVREPMTQGQRSYGVKFSADGERVALSIAVYAPGAPVFVDGIFERGARRKDWLVEWLAARADEAGWIVIDGKSGAQDLYDRLEDAGVSRMKLHLMTTGEMIAACSNFDSGITEKAIAHCGQDALAYSVCGCVKRTIGTGGGWGLGSSELADSTLAESAVIANWAALNTPMRPDREARIG